MQSSHTNHLANKGTLKVHWNGHTQWRQKYSPFELENYLRKAPRASSDLRLLIRRTPLKILVSVAGLSVVWDYDAISYGLLVKCLRSVTFVPRLVHFSQEGTVIYIHGNGPKTRPGLPSVDACYLRLSLAQEAKRIEASQSGLLKGA